MRALTSICIASILALLGACSSKEPVVSKETALSPAQIKFRNLEARSNWRKRLGWDQSCEDGFLASYAGLESGVEVQALTDHSNLVSVLCSAGAYQPSFLYFFIHNNDHQSEARLIEFPIYTADGGSHTNLKIETEIWGESLYDSERGELNILNVARQTRDCGSWAVYNIDGGSAELLELWTRYPCPSDIETPAEQKIGLPPPGWVRVDHEATIQ